MKKSKANQSNTEERLKLAVASGRIGIWEYNIQSNELIWNDTMFELYGTRRENFNGAYEAWSTLLHPEDRAATETALENAIKGLSEYKPEFRIIWPNGDVNFILGHAQVIRDEAGNAVSVIGTNWDNQAEAKSQQQLQLAQATIETSQTAFFRVSSKGKVVSVNEAACRSLGYSRDELVDMCVWDFDPNLPHEAWPSLWGELKETKIVNIESQHQRKDGSIFPVEVIGSITTIAGEEYSFVYAEDVTERKKTESALKLTQFVVDHSSVEAYGIDTEGRVLYVNQTACKEMGFSEAEMLSLTIFDIDKTIRDEKWSAHWQDLVKGKAKRFETTHSRKNGTTRLVEVSANYVNFEGKEYNFFFVRDITDKKASDALVWKYANLDYLTGLPNRRMFQDRVEQEIKKARRNKMSLQLLFLDLDNFKEVNDALGHAKGDMLLIRAAERLANCIRESDTVARFGGDEFTILLSEVNDTDNVDRVIENILQALSEPFHLDDDVAYVSVSIGITCYPKDGKDLGTLLKNADQAMYVTKAAGRNGFNYYTPALQATAQARMALANDLRSALLYKQLWVAYQPIIELSSGRIVKAEALIRWNHPKLGLVSPAEFIPIAEHTGLINDIGEFVFLQAAYQTKRWQKIYDSEFQTSVNVSPVQINDKSGKKESWHQQLKKLALAGRSIVVEITEGLLLEANTSIIEKLHEYRDAGTQLALDDFGTGYSSLSYLKKFDIDYIKIDQSFVRNLAPNSDDLALCEAMIVMAHKLGLKVIAEGVETTEHRDLLIQIKCDYAQGYLFSRPLQVDKFESLLKS